MKIVSLISYFCFFVFLSCGEIHGNPMGGLDTLFNTPEYNQIFDASPVFCSENKVFHKSKILFVVDKTKTNKNSDPEGVTRLSIMKNLIEEGKNQHVDFAFISFSKTITSPLTINDIPVFRSNSVELEKAVNEISLQSDEGKKNYSNILNWIEKSIENDMENTNIPLNNYYIVFISDFHPVAKKEQLQFNRNISLFVNKYKNVDLKLAYSGLYENKANNLKFVVELVGLGIGIALIPPTNGLSTMFMPNPFNNGREFETTETDDVAFAKNLSENTEGDFVDFNKTSKFSFQSNLEKTWNMDFFLVYNLNEGFCSDGYKDLDSDGDGLCDRDEQTYSGFNKNSRFSFNDGYGDYFHYVAIKEGKTLSRCSDRKDEDHDLLTVCEEDYLNSLKNDPKSIFQNSSSLKTLKTNNPDSDGDGIIDGIETLVYHFDEMSAPMDSSNLKQIREGNSVADKELIKRHISPFVSEDEQVAYNTILSPFVGENSSCYGIQQSQLPLYSTVAVEEKNTMKNMGHKRNENVILIYSMHKTSDKKNYVYQFTYKKIEKNNNQGLQQPFQLTLNDRQFDYLTFENSSDEIEENRPDNPENL